jgi:NADH-quinone oxidoreductase subunit J
VNDLASRDLLLAVAVILLGASGTYLLLPHRHGQTKPRRAHVAGALLVGIGVLLLALFWRVPGPLLQTCFFYAFGLAAVGGGVLTITSRNPIYSALWFASVVLSTSGLFLLTGAQFLAAGTVIVYAGAIIVTFLFVIMLARAEGHAAYDRTARSPGRASLTGFLLLWGLMYALLSFRGPADLNPAVKEFRLGRASQLVERMHSPPNSGLARVAGRAIRETAKIPEQPTKDGVPTPHVAGLGGTLYTDHLISVEVAGVLLFVALIGALAIATPRAPVRPGEQRA